MYFICYLSFIVLLIFGEPAWAEKGNSIERIPREESPTPKVNYGHIFIEETRQSVSSSFEFSVFGGQEIGSPYIQSSFLGMEIKYRMYSPLYLGFEYSVYTSRSSSAIETISDNMSLYGLQTSYSFLQSTVYINWHYRFLKSYLNLAGRFKVKMGVPVQLGLGLMRITEKGLILAVKWGVGPLIQLSPRLGVQLIFSQSLSVERPRFLYTWCSFNLVYSL